MNKRRSAAVETDQTSQQYELLKFRLTRNETTNANSNVAQSSQACQPSSAIIRDLASCKQQQPSVSELAISPESVTALKLPMPIFKLAEHQQPSASFSSSILVSSAHRRHNSRSLYTLARNLRRRIHSMLILRRSGNTTIEISYTLINEIFNY